MTSPEQTLTPWLTRPLCRRYVLGVFDVAIVRLRDASGVRRHRVHWACGWLADGHCEPLGAWAGGPQGLPLMLADLRARGVERIWHVAASNVGGLQNGESAALAIEGAFPGALAAPLPRALSLAQLAAEQVGEYLIRVIRRHGRFENEAVALDFVAVALQRAERRLDRERVVAKERPRLDLGAQMAPRGI